MRVVTLYRDSGFCALALTSEGCFFRSEGVAAIVAADVARESKSTAH